MQVDVLQYIPQFLKNSGNPVELITLLSENYTALPISTKVVIKLALNNGHMDNFYDTLIVVLGDLILKNYQSDIADNFIKVHTI